MESKAELPEIEKKMLTRMFFVKFLLDLNRVFGSTFIKTVVRRCKVRVD